MNARTTDPTFVIPLFFSSGPQTRIAICLLVHPVLLEAGEAISRGTKGDAVAQRLWTGEIKTFEEAALILVEDAIPDSASVWYARHDFLLFRHTRVASTDISLSTTFHELHRSCSS